MCLPMKCELSKNNSRTCQYFIGSMNVTACILILFFLNPVQGQAQMFSIGEERRQFDMPQSAVYIGLEPVSVDYFGDDTSAGAGSFEFDGTLIRLRYETPGINLFLATGGSITGIENHTYFDVGGNLGTVLPLYVSEGLIIQIPLELKSIFTTMTNSQFVGTTSGFRFGSLMGGLGARMMVRLRDDIRFEISSVPNFGVTFASGGFFGGSMSILSGSGRFYIDRLFGDVGLSFGYDYNYKKYNVDESLFDYKINAHSLQVGLTF